MNEKDHLVRDVRMDESPTQADEVRYWVQENCLMSNYIIVMAAQTDENHMEYLIQDSTRVNRDNPNAKFWRVEVDHSAPNVVTEAVEISNEGSGVWEEMQRLLNAGLQMEI